MNGLPSQQLLRLRQMGVGAAVVAASSIVLWLGSAFHRGEATAQPSMPAPPFVFAAAPAMADPSIPLGDREPDRVALLRRGETLAQLFSALGLPSEESFAATTALARYVDPRSLRAGESYAAYFTNDAHLTRFRLAIAGKGEVTVERQAAGWVAAWREFDREVRLRSLAGRLDGTLERSIESAGGEGDLAYAMADVLQWDLDFTRDLRTGDAFEVLFEEIWLEGKYYHLGRIVGLSYQNRGKAFQAFRFGDEGGYYDGEGRPLEKMFLRAPLAFSRITSRFSTSRFHPILGEFRPHWGVDYGAPVGTPVRATAAGEVVAAGWDGGGGKVVKLRHPNGFVTEYMHLSRFASGIHPGVRVRQGEEIAFTGATGLATGPHLDYRVQQNGRWIDPLSLPSNPAPPLAAGELDGFKRARDAMRASLATVRTLDALETASLSLAPQRSPALRTKSPRNRSR